MNASEYVKSFQSVSVLKLDGIRQLMSNLGNPEKNLKFIHIAGTNGKGSVCEFIQKILTVAGYKCGKFSSPALINHEDCISVDGKAISTDDFEKVLNEINSKIDGQSQFEVLTAAALVYFNNQRCDYVVMECGMGGIGDATNIIPPPVVGVITRIDIDHTSYLGDTIEEITCNKCGILKEGTKHTVTIEQNTTDIIKRFSKGTFHIAEKTDLPTSLAGMHQKENAGIAVKVCRVLGVGDEYIKQGLLEAKHPGRFEIFDLKPPIIYDGAHNPNGVRTLCENIPDGPLTLICAFMADKDIDGIFSILKEKKLDECAILYCTTVSDNPRAMNVEDLYKLALKNGFNAFAYPNIKDALKARKGSSIVFGSLYLYKEFTDAIKIISESRY